MTKQNTIEFWHTIRDKYLGNFDSLFTNLIWQLVVNKLNGDCMIVFYPVSSPAGVTYNQIGIVELNVDGYVTTGVHFKSDNFEDTWNICQNLNSDLFGIDSEIQINIVGTSMKNYPVKNLSAS